MEKIIKDRINIWLSGAYDEEAKAEIRAMQNNAPNELIDAFYKDLEFGTGGLRGIMGVGTNRMNKYTVAMATQGLSNYVKTQTKKQKPSVVIAYDSRNNSYYFSEITAEVLSANGFQVYLFDKITPTPELSFAIRHLQCDTGIVITASHNPKEYNGYKVYWSDGGQLVPPHDNNVIEEVQKIKSIAEVNFQRNEKLITYIGEEIDKPYLEKIKSLSTSGSDSTSKDLKIVYTPLHGTGVYMRRGIAYV